MEYQKTLYKKDSKGKVRILTIGANEGQVFQTSGLLEGKKVEHVSLSKGKNIGKTNETTPREQAILEVKAKIKNKLDQGYFETIEETDKEVILPMLAKSYEKECHKIDWETAYVQPKLDGMRCLKKGTELMSRKGKGITTLPHISEEIVNNFDYLDGELYAHGLSFQENMKIIKKNRPESINVKYHVYDIVRINMSFEKRYVWLKKITEDYNHIELVPTFQVHNEEMLKVYHRNFISEGYEGSILRWGNDGYTVNKRSSNLLKYKDFIDGDYEIVDIEPSDKKPEHGVVICKCKKTGETFGTGMKVSHKEREEILLNKNAYIGKIANVRFFEYTDSGIPRFPVFIGIHEDR